MSTERHDANRCPTCAPVIARPAYQRGLDRAREAHAVAATDAAAAARGPAIEDLLDDPVAVPT